MASGNENALVGFLRQYGPIETSDNMYDEFIQAEMKRFGIDQPIAVDPPRLGELTDNFLGSDPHSVILTGTAGDGKTFHCRRLWEALGGSPDQWSKGEKVARLTLGPCARELIVVKDLSELTASDKAELLPGATASLLGEDTRRLYLIAANDGQLLASWREWAEPQGGEAMRVFRRIERMLVEMRERDPDDELSLQLYNLSLLDPSPTFDALLEQVLEHPMWGDCGRCTLASGAEEGCPIRINRARLRGSLQSNPFRRRLAELLRLASASRMHLPIRHLLLLAVNTLLGDQGSNKALLTCRTAKNRAEDNEYSKTSPYANVFGTNLREKHRRQYQVFSALDTFGIGRETDNAFDTLLVYGNHADGERYERLIASDERHGESAYRRSLDDYLEGERNDTREFMGALARQRQRLFFSLPEGEPGLNQWQLSVYRHAGDYLELCDALGKGRRQEGIERALVRGLNRTFCGMLIEDAPSAYLASSGGDGRGQIACVLNHEVKLGEQMFYIHLVFALPEGGSVPEIIVRAPMPNPGTNVVGRLELPLTHFEYLMRVAHGSLPASFSQQCYEDLLDFKLLLIAALDRIFGQPSGDESHVVFASLAVNANGRPEPDEFRIEVR